MTELPNIYQIIIDIILFIINTKVTNDATNTDSS